MARHSHLEHKGIDRNRFAEQDVAVLKDRPKPAIAKSVVKGIVGLTADPKKARRQHRNPMGWTVEGAFLSENAAREWKQYYVGQGYTVTTEETGWRYGHRYPIANSPVN